MAVKGKALYTVLERIQGRVVKTLRSVCVGLVTVMMLLTALEVVSRGIFNFSLQVSDEISAYLLVGITFLAVTVALDENALFRVEFFFDRLPPHARLFFRLAFDALSLLVAGVLEYELVLLVITSIVRENKSLSILSTPLYIPQLVMPIGMAALMFMFAVSIVKDVVDIEAAVSNPPDAE